MHGYTPATKGANIADDDFAYLKAVLKTTSHPVIAEGKVDTPAKMKRCLDLGCHAVVVGGAITRPLQIAKNFIDAL
jgi:N-acylglucosamine-6-phosphate 2-epimerase